MNRYERYLRPFSRWNLEPYADESAVGYFRRLVANEEHNSASVYAKEVGLNGRDPQPGELLEAVLSLPVPENWKTRLKNATPVVHRRKVVLAGETIRRCQWSSARRRFCPCCLYEAAYDRTWWDVLAIRVCPFHGIPLVSRNDGGFDSPWWWPYAGQNPKGGSLAVRPARSAPNPAEKEAYFLGRLGFAPRSQVPMLDRLSLGDAMEVCEFIGLVLNGMSTKIGVAGVEKLSEQGYHAVSAGYSSLVSELARWIAENVPPEVRDRGLEPALRSISHKRRQRLSRTASAWFRRVLSEAFVVASLPSGAKELSENMPEDDMGIVAAAEHLQVPTSGLIATAVRLGITPDRGRFRGRVFFSPKEISRMREFFDGLVTFMEAAAILGLPRFQVTPLIEAGHLEAIRNVNKRKNPGGPTKLIGTQVEALLQAIVGPVPVIAPDKETRSLTTAAQWLQIEPGRLAALVASGRISPVGRGPGELAFKNLRFERSLCLPPDAPKGWIRRKRQACKRS